MSWPLVALKDVVDINIGRTPSRDNTDYWGDGTPWLSIRDMNQGKILLRTAEQITHQALEDTKIGIAKKGTILFSFKLSIGKVGVAGLDMCHNEAIASMPIKQGVELCEGYFYYALKQLDSSKDTDRAVMGATLNKKKMAELKIPLPPLEIQKKIAAVLEKADQLRKDCQQMEQELNSLAQSVFIDMFGDPVTNPKRWEMKALSELANIVTGNTPSRAKLEYYGSDIEWIKSGNINTPSDYLTIADEYLSEEGKKVGRVVQSGSILMTCIAGSPNCIGNIAIADREVAFNQQINALVPKDKKLDTEFLYILLKVAKKIIQSASTNSMKGMISKSRLESIQLPFPSYAKQCDFSVIYKKLQKEIKRQNEQVIETGLMFDALMQKAFKGELDI